MNSRPPWSRFLWIQPDRRTVLPASARRRAPQVWERKACIDVQNLGFERRRRAHAGHAMSRRRTPRLIVARGRSTVRPAVGIEERPDGLLAGEVRAQHLVLGP